MNTLKFISYLVFCFLITNRIVLAKPIPVIIYADAGYPPYSYAENGQAKGIYTDILLSVFEKMPKYAISIQPVPWKRGLKYLKNGSGFALYPPYLHANQRPYIFPYSLPILEEKVSLFCREEITKQGRIKWPEDFYGLTIGNNAGFRLGGKAFWKAVESGDIKLDESHATKENILKLQAKRFDCYMNDRISILWEINNLKQQEKHDISKPIIEVLTISTEQGYLGFTNADNGKFHYKKDFIIRFNTALTELQKSGKVHRIIDSYLN